MITCSSYSESLYGGRLGSDVLLFLGVEELLGLEVMFRCRPDFPVYEDIRFVKIG